MSESPGSSLLHRVAHAMFWNALLLPAIAVFNLLAAVLIRRMLGLESGAYDILLGVINSVIAYAALGIPAGMAQFVHGVEGAGGVGAVREFLRQAALLRLGLVLVLLVPLNLLAPNLSTWLGLGDGGVLLLRLASILTLLRAANDQGVRALQAMLAHLRANLMQLLAAVLAVAAIAAVVLRGGQLREVMFALIVAAAIVQVLTRVSVRAATGTASGIGDSSASPLTTRRFWSFVLFMYLFDLSNYFAMPAFASPALAAVSDSAAPVALFNVAFQIPQMVVVVTLAGFQGLYRPLFARLMGEDRRPALRTAYEEVSKVQLILLLPAGVGLGVLMGDYLPLLFSDVFAGAVPMARVLCALLFVEAALNLGLIILSVDHRYGQMLAAQALRVLAAPAFVLLAADGHLLAAAAVFGCGRVSAMALAHLLARRRYGLRLPLAFALRAALPSLTMGAVLVLAHPWGSGPAWTVALTALGAIVWAAGMRIFGVLGEREIELLRRSRLPGRDLMIAWLGGPAAPANR